MMTPVLFTIAYICSENKGYLVWEYDSNALSYEIYRNGNLLDTIDLKDLDTPFMFLRFPRNTHLRNKLLNCKMYVDETIKRFNEYEYKVRAVYEDNQYSQFSNIKYIKCE